MAKSFIDVVQDSPRTGLRIPVKTKKNPFHEPIRRPRNRLSALNFAGSWFQLRRVRLFRRRDFITSVLFNNYYYYYESFSTLLIGAGPSSFSTNHVEAQLQSLNPSQ